MSRQFPYRLFGVGHLDISDVAVRGIRQIFAHYGRCTVSDSFGYIGVAVCLRTFDGNEQIAGLDITRIYFDACYILSGISKYCLYRNRLEDLFQFHFFSF